MGGVCLQAIDFASRFFLELNFSLEGHTLKGNFFPCLQIWTLAANCLLRTEYFFPESDFCTITSHFLNRILKLCYSVTFFCNWIRQNADALF